MIYHNGTTRKTCHVSESSFHMWINYRSSFRPGASMAPYAEEGCKVCHILSWVMLDLVSTGWHLFGIASYQLFKCDLRVMPRHFKLFLFSSLSMEWMKTPPTLSSPMPSPSKERIELDKVYHAISLKPTCSKIRGAFNFRSKLGFCPNRRAPPSLPECWDSPKGKKNIFLHFRLF